MAPEYAYAVDWLRRFGAALVKGKWEEVRELPDGRAQMVMEYPTAGDLALVVEHFKALSAMIREDAGSDDGPVAAELRAIVVRYHNGDD